MSGLKDRSWTDSLLELVGLKERDSVKPPLEVQKLLLNASEHSGKYRLVNGIIASADALANPKGVFEGSNNLKMRKEVAKVMKRGIIEQTALTINSGLTHVENKSLAPTINLVDNSLNLRSNIFSSTLDQSKFIEITLNTNYSAVNLPKKRRIIEEFNFADKKLTAFEVTRSQVLAGSTLSCLGMVTIDDAGTVKMSKLVAIVAGGVWEARKHLNEQIQHASSAVSILGFCSLVFFSTGLALYHRIK